MAILVAKALHLISPGRNERILHLFQMLIMHRPGKENKNKSKYIGFFLDI